MKKLTIIVLVILLVSVSLFAGCAKDEDSTEASEATENTSISAEDEVTAPVTIKFMTFSANSESGISLDEIKAAFEEQNPNIKVEIETLGYDDYFVSLQTKFLGNDAPDCFETNFENFVAYADQGLLANLEENIASSGIDLSILNQETVKAFNLDDTQYGLPYSFSNVVLIYNKDLFDQAELDYPTSDWTWADVDAAGAAIRELGEDIYGYYQPIQFYEFFKAVAQNGGSILNEDKTAFVVNSPQNVETLEHMMARINETNIMPTDVQLGGMGDWDLFLSGRLGMLVNGIWSFPTFTEQADFNWDIAVEPGNTQKATHFFANGLAVYAESEKKDAAFKWISFLSSSEEMAQFRLDNNWELSPSLYEGILEEYTKVTPPDNKAAVFESLDYLITTPAIVEFSMTADIIGQQLSAAASGEKTAQQALDDAQAELESKITLD